MAERKWVVAPNSNVLIPISLQPDGANLWYFKLRLLDLTEFIALKISKIYGIGLQNNMEMAKTQLVWSCLLLLLVVNSQLYKSELDSSNQFRRILLISSELLIKYVPVKSQRIASLYPLSYILIPFMPCKRQIKISQKWEIFNKRLLVSSLYFIIMIPSFPFPSFLATLTERD